MSIRKLREKKAAAAATMKTLLDTAAESDRDLNAEECAAFDAAKAEAESLDKQIARYGALEAAGGGTTAPAATQPAARGYQPTHAPGPEAKKEFETFGEFMHAVRYNSDDQRLRFEAAQNMENGVDGGFAVPTQFVAQLRKAEEQAAVVRPRATVIPAGSPPDAAVTMPALNQSDTNMRGGVVVNWIGEGDTKPETAAKLKEITLQPKEVAAHVVITDKLLRNWTASESVITELLRGAITQAEELAFIQGNGVAKPLGVINSGAFVAIDRNTGDAIKFVDIATMLASAKTGGSLVWTYNPTILPQLLTIQDAAGRYIFIQGDATKGIPGTLMGYPCYPNENQPVLGDPGDLILADWSAYLIKDGSGPFVAASPHVHFVNNKTVIKIFWNVDGQPWSDDTLLGEDGVERSQFVGMAA